MNRFNELLPLSISLLLLISGTIFSQEVRPGKKIISAGWDMPTTEYMRENWEAMDARGIFDGCTFNLSAVTPDGKKRVSSLNLWDGEKWEPEWFQSAAANLDACKFQHMTENFILIISHPGTVRWEDEAGWNVLREKFTILSQTAKHGKIRGFALDFEDYGGGLFIFHTERGLSWEDTKSLVRRRGREFMQALTSSFPDADFLAYNLNNMMQHAGNAENPDAVLESDTYGLLPFFLDGMLDALPENARLIDGCGYGYVADSLADFQTRTVNVKQWNGPCERLVSPENRRKYRAQLQTGFGLYLDSYINPPGSSYYFGEKDGGTRLEHFAENLATALSTSDEYVWLYGEGGRWYGQKSLYECVEDPNVKSVGKFRSWEVLLPGISDLICRVKNPHDWALCRMEALKKEGKLLNLAQNPSFSEGESGKMPSHYSFWQNGESHGTARWDETVSFPGTPAGACLLENTAQGCILQSVPAVSGERYFICLKSRRLGYASVSTLIQWQHEDGAWNYEVPSLTLFPSPLPDSDWCSCSAVVTVPPDCGRIVITPSVKRQAPESKVWFDELEIYKL